LSTDSPPRAFVIGHPIAHSRSPLIHGTWLREHGLNGTYEKIDVAPESLPGFIASLRENGFVGGNVTVPHKTAVQALVTRCDEAARAIGAVNTLWFDGADLVGGNTDATGFTASLDAEQPGWDAAGRTALVLGAGGAARAVVFGLRARGFEVLVANRTFEKAAALAVGFGRGAAAVPWGDLPSALGRADLLVNTTSVGMAGKPALDLDLAPLPAEAVVADIVYVPLETDLLRRARDAGHRVVGGLGMLLHQAVPGFARWFGVMPAVTPALREKIEADVRAAIG
jgi:shikimate dehydrogenase